MFCFQVPYLFIHHTVTPEEDNLDDCAARVRSIQDYHMDTNGWSDIGYRQGRLVRAQPISLA